MKADTITTSGPHPEHPAARPDPVRIAIVRPGSGASIQTARDLVDRVRDAGAMAVQIDRPDRVDTIDSSWAQVDEGSYQLVVAIGGICPATLALADRSGAAVVDAPATTPVLLPVDDEDAIAVEPTRSQPVLRLDLDGVDILGHEVSVAGGPKLVVECATGGVLRRLDVLDCRIRPGSSTADGIEVLVGDVAVGCGEITICDDDVPLRVRIGDVGGSCRRISVARHDREIPIVDLVDQVEQA
jgi:hypothetical protein